MQTIISKLRAAHSSVNNDSPLQASNAEFNQNDDGSKITTLTVVIAKVTSFSMVVHMKDRIAHFPTVAILLITSS